MASLIGFVRALDRAADWAGLKRKPASAATLVQSALRRAGRSEIREPSVHEFLELLLECYGREANLNIFGYAAAKWDALRCLTNLIRFEQEEEHDRGVLEEVIDRPIFITGLPRSGTTFLHTLLSQDSHIQVPRCWQMIFPYPQRSAAQDRRARRVQNQLRFFQSMAPELALLHPMSADSPQECTEITAQVFQSLRYEMTHRVPSYQKWLDGFGHLGAYRFHKRFLQHLQHQGNRGQWVLKCPDHIHALGAIREIYPDARFVFVHRDPLRVIPSAAKLTETVRRPFTRHTDAHEIGRQVVERAVEAANIMTANNIDQTQPDILHVQYRELASDPLATIQALYTRFGLTLQPNTRERMERYVGSVGQNGTGGRYSFEEFGLNRHELCQKFKDYMDHFSVSPETESWKDLGQACAPIAA